MDILTGLVSETWIACITAFVTCCAAISVALPPPGESSGKAYKTIYRVVQWIALNFGRAKNAGDPTVQKTVPDDGKR